MINGVLDIQTDFLKKSRERMSLEGDVPVPHFSGYTQKWTGDFSPFLPKNYPMTLASIPLLIESRINTYRPIGVLENEPEYFP